MPHARKPVEFTREEFALLLQERHSQHFAVQAQPGLPPNKLCKVMVFRELHSDGNYHIYAVVLADRPYGPTSVQRALRTRDKVFVSFGMNHAYFWFAVVYASVPSTHKGPEEMDPNPYHSEGLTLREELADVPKGARRSEKDRVRAHLGLPLVAAGNRGNPKPALMSEEDFAELVVSNKWRALDPIFEAAREQKVDKPGLYNLLLRMGRKKMVDTVSWIWALQGDKEEPDVDRVQRLMATAQSAECSCHGRWVAAVERLLEIQGVDSMNFRSKILRALRFGRRKGINVLILGAPDAGKSFAIKPLYLIFDSFIARGQNETFALQGIHGSEICYLQDVRYESFGLPWDDWLRWGENEPVMVRMPRTTFGESKLYEGTAPLFATMATLFTYPLADAKRYQRNVEYENKQFRSRWDIIKFNNEIPEHERDSTLDPCAKCAATWYSEAAELSGPPPPAMDAAETPAPEAAQQSAGSSHQIADARPVTAPTVPSPKRRKTAGDPSSLMSQLSQLVQWKAGGTLSPSLRMGKNHDMYDMYVLHSIASQKASQSASQLDSGTPNQIAN